MRVVSAQRGQGAGHEPWAPLRRRKARSRSHARAPRRSPATSRMSGQFMGGGFLGFGGDLFAFGFEGVEAGFAFGEFDMELFA